MFHDFEHLQKIQVLTCQLMLVIAIQKSWIDEMISEYLADSFNKYEIHADLSIT